MIGHHYACGQEEGGSGSGVSLADFEVLILSDAEDGSIVFSDSSLNAHTVLGSNAEHSTNVGSPFSGINSAISLYTATSYLMWPIPAIISPITIDFWCYLTDTAFGNLSVFSSVFRIFYNSGNLGGQWTNVYNGSPYSPNLNEWFHVALCVDGDYIYLFKNGQMIAAVAYTGGTTLAGNYVYLGGYSFAKIGYYTNYGVRLACVWSGSGYSVGDTVFTPPTEPYGS